MCCDLQKYKCDLSSHFNVKTYRYNLYVFVTIVLQEHNILFLFFQVGFTPLIFKSVFLRGHSMLIYESNSLEEQVFRSSGQNIK